VSALIILGVGGVYGFLMLGVISFYELLLVELLAAWLTAPLAATGLKDNLPPAWFLFTAGVMLAAGVAAAVRWVLGAASLGAIESTAGLRPVNPADLEERQLANIVSEMAIAGGVPEPRVLLMEGDVVNAGAAGKGPCTVFVSRRLLDHLDRDETLGHLLASIANGDLLAFMERMLNLPFPLGAFNKVVGSLILMLFMPLILSRLAGFLIYTILTLFILGPFIAFAIRARRALPTPPQCN
jgi:Zn-dependent protease with chaperone function